MKTKTLIIVVFLSCIMGVVSSGIAQPLGTIMAYSLDAKVNQTALEKDGWRVCDGTTILRKNCPSIFDQLATIYGRVSDNEAYLPNLQGMFLRGIDPTESSIANESRKPMEHAQIMLPSRIGSIQMDALQSHTHYLGNNACGLACNQSGAQTQSQPSHPPGQNVRNDNYRTTEPIDANVSTETRPKNAYVYWIIKVK